MSSNWEDVKARKELRRLALELDPYVSQVGNTKPRMFRLSTAVEVLGWEKAEADYPEVSRFLDRLGAQLEQHEARTRTALHTLKLAASERDEARARIDDFHRDEVAYLDQIAVLAARIEKALALCTDLGNPHDRLIRVALAGEEKK